MISASARSSYSKLKNFTSFNPQNSNSAKIEYKKPWKIRITRAQTQNTWAKVKLDTCSNSKIWNLMKLKLDKKDSISFRGFDVKIQAHIGL